MAWTTVETPNAKYVLIFGHHKLKIPYEKSPIKYDALVLETSGVSRVFSYGIKEAQPYKNLINQAIKNQKQIWLTDPAPTFKSRLDY